MNQPAAPATSMKLRFATALETLPPYPLQDLPAIKREMKARGEDLIDLGAGDADLPPPPAAVEALKRAVDDPANSRYAFQLGLPAYREEIARYMEERFGVTVDPFEETALLVGSKDAVYHLPIVLLDPGDVVIMPDPGYASYFGGTHMAGGAAYQVPLRPENDFLIRPEDIPADVARAAKLIYLNYPNNPTAAEASREYLGEMVAFCRDNSIVLCYDNAYAEMAFDGYVPPSILEIDGAREVAIELHSMSKTYNMTGWRTGWAVGRRELIGALVRVKTFSDTGVPFTIQHAATAALRSREEWLPGNLEIFRRRRDAAIEGLQAAGYDIEAPRSTMYLWVPVPGGADSAGYARRLLTEQAVAVVPGIALGQGGEGFVRLALTLSEERIREAAERMGRVT